MNLNMTEIVVVTITAIVAPITVMLVKSLVDKYGNKGDKVRAQMKINDLIVSEIDQLLFSLGCDRVTLSQFHNGGYVYPTGASMQKISVFYESVADGIQKISTHFQNIPCGIFSEYLSKLIKDDELYVNDFSSNEESYGLDSRLNLTTAKSSFLHSIKSSNGKIIGVLEVDFVKNKHEFTAKEMDLIREKSAVISGILLPYNS